ncbi:MAG: hypothetical protein L0Z50_08625 [Verrucomicrobiales bacterium]|nr:hypothetical protein [Verrucomicrobiales bacterium]
MSVSPIITSVSAGSTAERLPIQTLGQDEFLKLLVAQMTSQDPLNPQKDTEFIAQMAQFSALEQSKTMQADMAQLRTQQELLQANALIGQTVELQLEPELTARGIVAAVEIDKGTPNLIVNGQPYDLDQVRLIESTTLPRQVTIS